MDRELKLKEKLQIYIKNQKKLSLKGAISILLICTTSIIVISELRDIYVDKKIEYKSTKGDSIFKASFMGDIIMGRNIKKLGDKVGYSELFKNVSKIYEDSDYISGNFETPILTKEYTEYTKANKNIHLSSTTERAEVIKQEGIDVVSLSNNHAYDYKEEGLKETIELLKKNDIKYVGAGKNIEEARVYDIENVNGVKIANIGISDVIPYEASAMKNKEGILTSTNKENLKIIEKAKKEADLVVVNIHWGEEYSLNSNEYQKNLARKMIDMGADIIIGHHPHVIHSIETYKDGIIFYSAGNFIFDQGWSRTKDSIIINYTLSKEGKGQFEVVPLRIVEGGPVITNNKLYTSRILGILTKELKESDNWRIEEDKLIIDATGI
ncbi:CapA family protein [Romboutsia sp. 1001216sp1]|uniref:CapA family protein n=1 Tax=unclassified Romboutsia TaxID=2626894 RepID=UPI00189F1650|nr:MULTISPECIES: CapA family protein [unclassified Romboutsia]MDB8791013.1 CapA family protein [Romboutsia sp. 1001216sp1]MDB8801562.1 CapA family protein [Romboutsia sp. 1001216sp1]MDB8812959.1 CapA family protein [Romboutsia sp. 1001216sp1]